MKSTFRRPRYRRLAPPIAALLCTPMLLTTVAQPASASTGKVTIEYSYLWGGAASKVLQGIIADFNSSQNKIFVKGVSNPSEQAQLADMAASTGAFSISDNFAPTTADWASKGILYPLSTFIKKDHYALSDFVPAGVSATTYKGVVYQLPVALNDTALIYNKADFAAAGIASPPQTFTEMAADIAKLTKVGPNGITQLGFGNETGMAYGTNVSPDYMTLGMAFGGSWFNAQGQPTPSSAGNVAAANFYIDNVVKKVGVSNLEKFASGYETYDTAQDPFIEGKIAMVTDGEWQPAYLKMANPNFKYGVAPIPYPQGKPQLANTTWVQPGTLFIPRNAPQPAAAWTFMKYLLSPKPMLKFDFGLDNLPARKFLHNPIYNSLGPGAAVYLNLLLSKNAHSLPSETNYSQYTAALATAQDSISLLKQSPQQAYGSVAQQLGG